MRELVCVRGPGETCPSGTPGAPRNRSVGPACMADPKEEPVKYDEGGCALYSWGSSDAVGL